MAALLPSIAVVFTVAGPVVYETKTPSVRVSGEKNDSGRVFDRTISLDQVPDGYKAMNEREAIKIMVKP